MTTVTYKPGASGPLVVSIADDAGASMDDLPRQLRIGTGSECRIIATTWDGEYWVADLSTLDLPPRLYPVSVYYQDGGNWRLADTFNILIEGGC
jgi:hypothetical protein